MSEATERPARHGRGWTAARWIVGVTAALIGGVSALGFAWVGHCSAFGGRCPADPGPLLDNDSFRLVTMIVAATVMVVYWCVRPTLRGALVGLAAGGVAGVVAGLMAVAYGAG